jgi:uncharacterized protein
MDPLVGVLAFCSEFLDSSLGMGYGTALVPLLLFIGHDPLQVIPAVLISQLATDIVTMALHHKARNVDFRPGSQDLKVAITLGAISSIGVMAAVIVAVNIPKDVLSAYIGSLVLVMGVLVFYTASHPVVFSWKKLMALSLVASFNKGISGGGYGPLVMGGQMLSGVGARNAVGITACAEAVTCLVGFIVYLVSGRTLDWSLIAFLTISAVAAVPLAVFAVRKTPPARLKKYIGALIALLGLLTLCRLVSKG